MSRMRTSLDRVQGISPMDDNAIRSAAAKLWHDTKGGSIMLRLDWLHSDMDRHLVNTIGEMMFGKVQR